MCNKMKNRSCQFHLLKNSAFFHHPHLHSLFPFCCYVKAYKCTCIPIMCVGDLIQFSFIICSLQQSKMPGLYFSLQSFPVIFNKIFFYLDRLSLSFHNHRWIRPIHKLNFAKKEKKTGNITKHLIVFIFSFTSSQYILFRLQSWEQLFTRV